MLGENMIMAFHAIMANKMRSFLTMLGIIIGIGSVISIVSIGDTMRGLFADLYKDAGATQAVVSIGYNVEDVRDSDYFTLDELDKIKEIFGDEISYIDSYASVNSEVLAGRTNMKFDFQGIDWNFSDVPGISLLVGGIGIMNIMLVSVTERTREIGIRKALGARTRDVLIQFLTESAILSALGGIIGVLLAVSLVTAGGAVLGLPVVIKPGIIILAVSFSAVVGIFFGIYPASKAAKADPIDALRYE